MLLKDSKLIQKSNMEGKSMLSARGAGQWSKLSADIAFFRKRGEEWQEMWQQAQGPQQKGSLAISRYSQPYLNIIHSTAFQHKVPVLSAVLLKPMELWQFNSLWLYKTQVKNGQALCTYKFWFWNYSFKVLFAFHVHFFLHWSLTFSWSSLLSFREQCIRAQ